MGPSTQNARLGEVGIVMAAGESTKTFPTARPCLLAPESSRVRS